MTQREDPSLLEAIQAAARAIAESDALLVTAGAGMGVDSGLPDFRGDKGFWQAYPAYEHLGLSFVELANPRWFVQDPELAWGFYGHRLALYRATTPHDGFARLRTWAGARPKGYFVYTSNVDNQFQRAGFEQSQLVECHGALETWQCLAGCGAGLFAAGSAPVVDERTFRAARPLPACPSCGRLARPNVLMFGDGGWDEQRTRAQEKRFYRWLNEAASEPGRLAIVECGAGTAVPSVRSLGNTLASQLEATLIRINVREATGGTIDLAIPAREALARIDEQLGGHRARGDGGP
jgi:NAD-dependent SIR2 family protein deacetylase